MLSGLILISAGLTIRADCLGARRQVYLFKPLTTTLILALALESTLAWFSLGSLLITIGLACSLAGDIALMWPGDHFVVGLACFLCAHLCYIAAFSVGMPLLPSAWPALLAVGAVSLAFGLLAPHLGSMRWPALAYTLAIMAMAWRAWVRWAVTAESGALLAFGGAACFVISDALLAANRFVKPLRRSPIFVLGPYFLAQWLIALSLRL
ncbi:MAG: lysoplasmalogenase [Anaerolineae bacterium]|nr:lysoplasmalogenase [Anaerolineae bacterium]